MAYGNWYGIVQDAAGNIVLDARVEVREEVIGFPRRAVYSDKDGLLQKSNPYDVTDGDLTFYAPGGFYRLRVTSPSRPGFEVILRDVPVGNLQGMDIEQSGLLTANWGAVVPDLVGRDAFNANSKGFSVLVEKDADHSDLPYIYYKLSDEGGTISRTFGTAIGNLTGSGGLAAAFNGTNAQALAACAAAVNTTGPRTIGKDWGAGVKRSVSSVVLYGPTNSAIARATGDVNTSVNAVLQGSNDNATWINLDTKATGTGNSAVVTFTPTSRVPYRYHRVSLPAIDGSSDWFVSQLVFNGGDWSAGMVFQAIRLKAALTLTLDASGSVIPTGLAHTQPAPFTGVWTGYRVTADGVGSLSVDVRKTSYADWPTEIGDSITDENPIAISGATKSEDFALSGWGLNFTEGDMLDFVVLEASSITKATVTLFARRT